MKNVVEQIKEALSIVDVVGSYVELHRAGKNYKGKSPFSNEKTPSFYVSPDRGMYYCFSTNQGGDMFTFVESIEGVDFKGALKILAERAGVEIVVEKPEKRSERDRHFALLEEVASFFFSQVNDNKDVVDYIAGRAVTQETRHAWKIGYAPDAWRSLREHLHARGYTDDEMLRAGVVKKSEKGSEPYDVFRNRVMFPIFDTTGRVIAFSGRTLLKDKETPKYVNSPETELFKKSEILYGYDKAKSGIRQLDFSLIVEGQFDVVLSHQAGYVNTVAVSGTAFTEHHIALLQRMSNRAVLAFDSDAAGIAAAKRAAEPMLKKGMDIKVASMIGGKDPADIVRENPLELRKLVGAAIPVVNWLLWVLRANARDERAFKLGVRDEVLPLVACIPDRIDREHFEQEVAVATGTTKDAIHYEIERICRVKDLDEEKHKKARPPVSREVYNAISIQKNDSAGIIGEYMLYFGALFEVLRTEKKKESLAQKTKEAFTAIVTEFAGDILFPEMPDAHEVNNFLAKNTKMLKKDFEELLRNEGLRAQADIIARELVRFQKICIAEAIRVHTKKLDESSKTEDAEGIREHLKKISELEKKKHTTSYEGGALLG